MPLVPLQFRPGFNRELTDYANKGGWFDGNLVRFRNGVPETVGGWTRYATTTFLGTCRSLLPWTALNGSKYLGLGTHLKLYVMRGGTPYDITPIRATTGAGDATFAAVDGSSILTVTDTAHGARAGDFVTFSSTTSLGGNITATVLDAEFQIQSVVDADTYTIDAGVVANASDTGNGGASTIAAYQINTGSDVVTFGAGWGAGSWGSGAWGGPAPTPVATDRLRLWSQANFGEDLLANVRDGGIYYWDLSAGLTTRAVALSSLVGANTTPTVAKQIMVSERDRHIIAFGCDGEFTIGTQDPMLIRFSDQESLTDWQSLDTNTAGELRLRTGSEIIRAVQTKQQIAIFTDAALYVMQYVGAPFTFGVSEVASNISIAGPEAAVPVGDAVYWMGVGEFYIYDGTVRQMPCTVKEYVFSDFNYDQRFAVAAGSNSAFGEVWWFYPSAASDTIDRYVVYNYVQNLWYYGQLSRTAWIDRSIFDFPLAAARDGYLYYHESGLDDGSQNPPVALTPYIQSSPFEIGEGDRFAFVRAVYPDVTFRSSDAGSPMLTMTLTASRYPGAGTLMTDAEGVTRTATAPVQTFTQKLDVRLRGRSVALRVESDRAGTAWRLGLPRLELRTDGGR